MTPSQQNAMRSMRSQIADKLVEIEDISVGYKIPMHSLTIVMRDPQKPGMYMVLTTEQGPENLRKAADLVTSETGIPVTHSLPPTARASGWTIAERATLI